VSENHAVKVVRDSIQLSQDAQFIGCALG
jgi:hypothetical protein